MCVYLGSSDRESFWLWEFVRVSIGSLGMQAKRAGLSVRIAKSVDQLRSARAAYTPLTADLKTETALESQIDARIQLLKNLRRVRSSLTRCAEEIVRNRLSPARPRKKVLCRNGREILASRSSR